MICVFLDQLQPVGSDGSACYTVFPLLIRTRNPQDSPLDLEDGSRSYADKLIAKTFDRLESLLDLQRLSVESGSDEVVCY